MRSLLVVLILTLPFFHAKSQNEIQFVLDCFEETDTSYVIGYEIHCNIDTVVVFRLDFDKFIDGFWSVSIKDSLGRIRFIDPNDSFYLGDVDCFAVTNDNSILLTRNQVFGQKLVLLKRYLNTVMVKGYCEIELKLGYEDFHYCTEKSDRTRLNNLFRNNVSTKLFLFRE